MKPYHDANGVTLYHGDVSRLETFDDIADGSVRTIVTSPPYFGLRDYGMQEQIGAEASLDGYVQRLVGVFNAARRVLADDGTLWLNLGDSFASGARASDLPAKNLLGVPWRVAFALQASGWVLRSDIIWAKSNPMPESVTDRPTKSHEHMFLFAKNANYYYDAAAIAEEAVKGDAGSRFDTGKTGDHQLGRAQKGIRFGGAKYGDDQSPESRTKSGNLYQPTGQRNKRDVWSVATVPFPGSHFAVYPPDLIRPCILAGSEVGDVVLDPFSGSGTTGYVARNEGRRYIGFDLNREYLDMSLKTRFAQPVMDIWPGDAA